jgi:hypothetical protein
MLLELKEFFNYPLIEVIFFYSRNLTDLTISELIVLKLVATLSLEI